MSPEGARPPAPVSRRLAWLAGLATLLGLLVLAAWHYRAAIPVAWRLKASELSGGLSIDHDARVVTADGTQLATSLYVPQRAGDRLPTVYIRMPYGRNVHPEGIGSVLSFTRRGYAVVIQDVRGTFDSTGEFAPWEHATADGAATLDWITRQPWSNGKVGTFGCSALGEMQYSLARARHPAHAAMVASGAGGAWGAPLPNLDPGGFLEGGVLQLAPAFGWSYQFGFRQRLARAPPPIDFAAAVRTLPLKDMVSRHHAGPNIFTDYASLMPADAGWKRLDLVQPGDSIDVPALAITTWGDGALAGTLALTELARSRGIEQHVVLAPGNHCDYRGTMASGTFGDLKVANASRPYGEWFLRWFDQKLRGEGTGLSDLPPYQFYVIGEDRWLAAPQWPPPAARIMQWHLAGEGAANSAAGGGRLSDAPVSVARHDRYTADPSRPVPSIGGPICCTGREDDRAGPLDQRSVEGRQDVLVYTSEPLSRPMRIAGNLSARLTVSSTAADADFIARLTHVWPDGRSTTIQEGVLRARYRSGPAPAGAMVPGERYVLDIPMRAIAYRIPAGHRLRLDIASSSFPRLDRNLQTGGDGYTETRWQVAEHTVYRGGAATSYVNIPVLDDAQATDAP